MRPAAAFAMTPTAVITVSYVINATPLIGKNQIIVVTRPAKAARRLVKTEVAVIDIMFGHHPALRQLKNRLMQ